MIRYALIVVLMATSGAFGYAQAQTKIDKRSAAGSVQQKGRAIVKATPLQSSIVDLKCESVFESADVGGNLAELTSTAAGAMLSGRDWRKPAIEYSKQRVWLPIFVEEYVGERMHQRVVDAGQLIDPNELNSTERRALQRADEILNRIVQLLPSDQPYEFKLFATSDESENLGANPGGFVYITRAALQRDSESLSFALAHEVSHVAKRHLTRELAVQIIDVSTSLTAIKAILAKDKAAVDGVLGAGLTLQKQLRRFSQAQEEEADGCAIRVLVNQPEFDLAKSGNTFLAELKEAGSAALADSHPNYPERAGAMHNAYARWGKTQYVGDASAGKRRQDVSPLAAAARFNGGNADKSSPGEEKQSGSGVGTMFRKFGDGVGGVLRSLGGAQRKEGSGTEAKTPPAN